MASQAQSAFFNIVPLAVRLQIYSYCIPDLGRAVHVQKVYLDRDFAPARSINCFANHSFSDWERDVLYSSTPADNNHKACVDQLRANAVQAYDSARRHQVPQDRATTMLALLLTCNRMRWEVEKEIYGRPYFVFSGLSIQAVCQLLGSLSPSARFSMRKLVLEIYAWSPRYLTTEEHTSRRETDAGLLMWPLQRIRQKESDWDTLWSQLASDYKLQTLHIKVYDRRWRYPEAQFLQPLQAMPIVPDFTVQLPWPRDYMPDLALESDEGHEFFDRRPGR